MSAVLEQPELEFDAETHTYRVFGRRVEHLTGVLDFFDQSLKSVPLETLEAAAELGTAVHKACELDDLRRLKESSVDPLVRPYLEGWRRFRREMEFVPSFMEEPLYHPEYDFACKPDRIGSLRGQAGWVVEIKSGAMSRLAELQTGAQALMAERHGLGPIIGRAAVYLGPQHALGYRFQQHKDPHDRSTFLSFLSAHRWLKRA